MIFQQIVSLRFGEKHHKYVGAERRKIDIAFIFNDVIKNMRIVFHNKFLGS